MPEGDTVWLAARRLDEALAGRTLRRFELRVPRFAAADLTGRNVREVVSRGKHQLTRFEGGVTLHSHLRMDGEWRIYRAGAEPAHLRHAPGSAGGGRAGAGSGRAGSGRAGSARAGTAWPAPPGPGRADRGPSGRHGYEIRAVLANDEWAALGYRVHDLALVDTAREATLVGHLGPDLLGPDWDPGEAVRRLAAQPERAIGEALLDQRNLAGVGNMYKAEVLFMHRLNPWAPTRTARDLAALVGTAHRLLYANREHPEQSTTGSLRRGEQHWVYDRAGRPCRRCGNRIHVAEQGEAPQARVTYWCPTCQPPADP